MSKRTIDQDKLRAALRKMTRGDLRSVVGPGKRSPRGCFRLRRHHGDQR